MPLMIVAFVFELFLFAADLGLISTPWSDRPQATKQSVIGKVSWKRQSVQTKSRDSILWQSSDKGEPLYSFDSVLTLKNSSAKLQLEGNIQIDLQENTLVVLEPQEKSDAQTFRIQFYKGDLRSKTGARRLAMQSGSWTVEAKPNTDLALKTLNSGRLSLEVRSGGASVQKGTGENSTQISSGTRLELSESRIEEQQSLTKNLQWSLKSLMINHYAFEFPVDFNLVWQGPAESLIAHNTRGDEIRYPVSSTDSNKLLSLDPGTWNFRLVNQQGTSQTLSVNLYPARKTKHIYPLPRSRADLKQELNFSWAPNPDAVSYMITLETTAEPPLSIDTKRPGKTHSFDRAGDYTWSVIGIDESGFEIPSYYRYPVYVIPDPLAPPVMKSLEPNIRKPARQNQPDDSASLKNENEKPHSVLALLTQFANLLLPAASAEETGSPPSPVAGTKKSVIFSWFPVPGADHYTIEISLDPGFVEPIVIEKVRSTEFSWTGFPLETVYYRVAAGQDNGRKGLFSEPQKVELSQLQSLTNSRSLQPGVRVTIEELTPRLQRQLEPTKLPQKEEAKIEDQTPAKPVADTREAEEKALPPEPLPEDMAWRVGAFWSSGFTTNSQVGADSVAASQEGYFLTRFGAHLALPVWGLGHFVIEADSLQAPWSVEDPDGESLQSDLIQKDQTLSLRFGRTGSSVDYGLFIKSYGIVERTGDEELEMFEIRPVGLAYFFRSELFGSWDSKHMLGLGYGDEFFHVQSDNYIYTPLLLWDDKYATIGLEFNVRFGNGESDRSYLGTNFSFRIGLEF